MNKNPQIDNYLLEGCGRCELHATPQCKVHNWNEELILLREIVLEAGLKEEQKWGVPCYTADDKNVAVVSAFKNYCSISFFKGALLKDPHSLLEKPGPNSQAGRLIKFTEADSIIKQRAALLTYIKEAIEIEKKGLQVEIKKNPEPIPEELSQKFEEDPNFEAAFEALTPGRQRGYILHFSQPKQSKTRISRIEKCTSKIFEGKGFHDR